LFTTFAATELIADDTDPVEFDEDPAAPDDPIPNAAMNDSPTLTDAGADVAVAPDEELPEFVVLSSAAYTATDNAIKASTNNFFILIPPFNFIYN
jgi:hypothetical protein